MNLTFIFSSLGLLGLANGVAVYPQTNFQERCSKLKETFHPDSNTQVLLSEFLKTGTNVSHPSYDPGATCLHFSAWTITMADACRLQLNITTSSTSSVIAEVWMPVDWAEKGKRFIMGGNGGLGGCIGFTEPTWLNKLGFATVVHNNGHWGNIGVPFFNRPEVVKDFVYRALLVATKVGKKAVTQFYGEPIKTSYYSGCSTGGRQGLTAAQEFPEEYDGIIAGAPANDGTGLETVIGYYYKTVGKPGSASFLTPEQWAFVHDLILQQCDEIDGVKDRVIEDPRKCNPRPEAILCDPLQHQTWEKNKCLTVAQVEAVGKIYQPFYGNEGKLIYPRFNPGGEILGAATGFSGNPSRTFLDWYRYVVFNNASWNPDTEFTLNAIDIAYKSDQFGYSTWKDLTKLKAAGTKLLVFHGLADGQISSENSYRYYEYVSRNMSLPSTRLDEFYRFFPIPGMEHCQGGDGVTYLGGIADGVDPRKVNQTDNIMNTMIRWVEEGKAPERLTGRKVTADNKVIAVKDHCKWPLQNYYKGGDPKVKDSWGCR